MFYNTAVVISTMNLPTDEKNLTVFDMPALWWLLAIASGGAGALMLVKLLGGAPVVRARAK